VVWAVRSQADGGRVADGGRAAFPETSSSAEQGTASNKDDCGREGGYTRGLHYRLKLPGVHVTRSRGMQRRDPPAAGNSQACRKDTTFAVFES
jgi:hypothetical protein